MIAAETLSKEPSTSIMANVLIQLQSAVLHQFYLAQFGEDKEGWEPAGSAGISPRMVEPRGPERLTEKGARMSCTSAPVLAPAPAHPFAPLPAKSALAAKMATCKPQNKLAQAGLLGLAVLGKLFEDVRSKITTARWNRDLKELYAKYEISPAEYKTIGAYLDHTLIFLGDEAIKSWSTPDGRRYWAVVRRGGEGG